MAARFELTLAAILVHTAVELPEEFLEERRTILFTSEFALAK
jgi:hypothetical protein